MALRDDSDLAGSIMRSRWTFGAKRSSLIVMVGTRTIHMPPDVRRLLYEDSALRRRFQEDGYVLVTEVNECKAYTLILDANGEFFDTEFRAIIYGFDQKMIVLNCHCSTWGLTNSLNTDGGRVDVQASLAKLLVLPRMLFTILCLR